MPEPAPGPWFKEKVAKLDALRRLLFIGSLTSLIACGQQQVAA